MALQEEFEQQGVFMFRYRSTLPLVFLLSGLLVFVYTLLYSTGFERVLPYNIYEIISIGVSFLGLLIRIFTVGYTPANTSGRNTTEQVADKLNTSGIYSTVRHPLYVGNFFMWLGPAMLTQNLWYIAAFVLAYWLYYERIMYAEEAFLRKKFGDTYIKWSEKTPAFILSFKNFTKPNIWFSWKKVLKKEKNGFTAIFVTFFLFRMIKDYIENKSLYNSIHSWLFYATLASIVIYFILKYLKKYTKVFDEKGR